MHCKLVAQSALHLSSLHLKSKAALDIAPGNSLPKCPVQKSQPPLYSSCCLLQWAACVNNNYKLPSALLVFNSNLLSLSGSEPLPPVEADAWVGWVELVSVMAAVSIAS